MKKRLKHAKDLSIGDTIKITGYVWEIDDITVGSNFVEIQLWLWASPRKRCTLRFTDRNFPVTVR